MKRGDPQLLGLGIYTIGEASRLARIPAPRIRRWAMGYGYSYRGEWHVMDPVIQRQLPDLDDSPALGFLDLQEIRFLDAFRNHGVSWHTLRIATERARRIVKSSHPFSTGKFRDDGRTILTKILKEAPADLDDGALHDIVSNQLGFTRILREYLKGLEFGEDHVERWYPLSSRRVVVDPTRSFGQPVVTREGVPTAVLGKGFKAEGSYSRVAEWYGVEIESVRAAIALEDRLRLAAA